MKVSFYWVDHAYERLDFMEVLKKANTKPKTPVVVDNSPMFLCQCKVTEAGIFQGVLIKIRDEDLPLLAKGDKTTREIEKDDDEGIGEPTAFLYDGTANCLAIQRSQHACTAQGLARFLEHVNDLKRGSIRMLPVIRRDAAKKFGDMETFTRIRFRIAPIDPSVSTAATQGGIKDAVAVMEHFKAPYADMTLSVGRKREVLSAESVKDACRELFNLDRKYVKKIEITGQDDYGDRSVIDLLEYRLEATVTVPKLTGRNARIRRRLRAVNEGWEQAKEEVTTLLPEYQLPNQLMLDGGHTVAALDTVLSDEVAMEEPPKLLEGPMEG